MTEGVFGRGVVYLAGVSSSPPWRFPGPLLRYGVDVVASTCSWVQVLLPEIHDLERLLSWSRAGWLRLGKTFIWVHYSVNRGVLPGQLGQVGLFRDLEGRES